MIPKEKWSELLDGLRQTIIQYASVKSNRGTQNNSALVLKRRRAIQDYLRDMNELRFNRNASDDDFWQIAVTKPFYTNRNAAVVEKYIGHMLTNYIGKWAELCSTAWSESGRRYADFFKDKGCFKNRTALHKVIKAARAIKRLKKHKPNAQIYELLDCDLPNYTSPKYLKIFHEKMNGHLEFGIATTFHLMTELGLPVIKPDRVLVQTAIRLGLIDSYSANGITHHLSANITRDGAVALGQNSEFCWALQDVFRQISDETKIPMRVLDFILVKLGQLPDEPHGFVRTICRDKDPLCRICSAQKLCAYPKLLKKKR